MSNIGEMVAEMSKPQSGVQHSHTPHHGKHPAEIPRQSHMDRPHQQAGHANGHGPSGPRVALVAGV